MEYLKTGNHYIVRLDKGEEIMQKLTELCRKEQIRAGSIVGLGAADQAVVGLFDTSTKVFKKKEIACPMEITSIIGNISTKDGETYLHIHVTLCDENLQAIGGHMASCRISATAELTVTAFDGCTVEREMNDEIGLNLYKF